MSEPIEIHHEEEATKGCYSYTASGAMAAMTYSKLGTNAIIIDHTEVPDLFRGQGVGLKLVTRAVEDARIKNIKILPLCPFAAAQFKKHAAQWADVLYH
ncbi:MAG: GNAT family N-acetyltransferase [Notoacmeibacter sp.]